MMEIRNVGKQWWIKNTEARFHKNDIWLWLRYVTFGVAAETFITNNHWAKRWYHIRGNIHIQKRIPNIFGYNDWENTVEKST